MAFTLPPFLEPDFSAPEFQNAPPVTFEPVETPGVAPQNYHATTIYPEYFQLRPGQWRILEQSRMDCVVVHTEDDRLTVTEFRNLKVGDRVACGRRENGEDGIFVHTGAFDFPGHSLEKFAFRSHLTRESAFSIDYDQLYDLLQYEKEAGFILWVLGPAVVFDHDSRSAFAELVDRGYVHGLLAGNAMATHDLEGALFRTALGQELYGKRPAALGHYHHLDALNRIRGIGSIARAVEAAVVGDGVMHALIRKKVPFVLAGSIRDDGPMPEVIADVYRAQDEMRNQVRRATTILCLATQLHTIATGNMAPSYQVLGPGRVRPVYFYTVDMSEFAVSKLADRGSLTARSILTNVQDFVVTVERGLRKRAESPPEKG